MLTNVKVRAAKARAKGYRLHDADGLSSEVRPNSSKFGVMDKFHAFFETLRSNGQISCSPLYFLLK